MPHPAAIRDLSPKIGDLAGILALFNAAGNPVIPGRLSVTHPGSPILTVTR